jgi:hypothetical protein
MRLSELTNKSLKNLQDPSDPYSGKAPKTSEIHDEIKSSLNPSLVFTDMDPGYDFYKFMMQAAASPNDIPVDHLMKAVPLAMPYTKEDEDMLHHALKRMGKKHTHITTDKSGEHKNVHNTSPVAAIKKNRYGV